MDFANVPKVNQLSDEKMTIQRSIQILTSGGRIISMTISGGSPPPLDPDVMIPPGRGSLVLFGNSATVQTSYITYPPQMVDAIKSAFAARLEAIEAELIQLGVTGLQQRSQP